MTDASSSKPDTTDDAGEPCWGMWTSLVTAWVLPATTARRTQHLPLRRAFVAHLLAAALVLILGAILSFSMSPYGMSISHLATELLDNLGLFVLELQSDPSGNGLALLGFLLSIEFGFLALAVLVMPWGARDERIGATYRHALRRVWLQSTHVIPIVLLVGGVAVGLAGAERAWWREHGVARGLPHYPVAPELLPSDAGYADAQSEYETALKYYRRESLEANLRDAAFRRTVPWYVRGSAQTVIQSVALMASLWWLWALVRALGADRSYLPLARAPTCDRCGYSLTGMSMESRCPECGEPVVESLGPDARSGTIWERRAEVGRLQAWWRCFVGTLFQPRRFGRQLALIAPETDYRYFFALHLPLIFCFVAAGFLACFLEVITNVVPTLPPGPVPFTGGVIYGCLSVIAAVLLTGLAALLGSAWYGFRERRNLMPGAIQVACYLSAYLTLCCVFAAGSGMAVVTLYFSGFYADWVWTPQIDDGFLAFLSWLVPNLLCLVVYFVLVVRGTAATRYANR